jgi:hypothetical protein
MAESRPLTPVQEKELLQKSAIVLELAAAASCVVEFYFEQSWNIERKLTAEEDRQVVDRVKARCGLDPTTVYQEARLQLNLPDAGQHRRIQLSLPAIVRGMRAFLEICPIDHLEKTAARARLEIVGHRCRVAYDAVKAFIIRNDTHQRRIVTLLGQKYQEAALEVDDVAALLDVHPVDAVALLEENGFARPLEAARLSDPDRQAIYASIRADRLVRNGEPKSTPEMVGRHVIASERIEGIDARRWIPREGLS